MRCVTSFGLAFVAVLLGSACARSPVAPGSAPAIASSSASLSAVTARMQPDVVTVTPVAGSSCPQVNPYTASGTLFIHGVSGMSVDSVTFRYLNGSAVTTHPMTFANGTFSASAPNVTLPFSHQVGCGIGRPAWVVVDVKVIDPRGNARTVTVEAPTE